jgi:hypothetical protein
VSKYGIRSTQARTSEAYPGMNSMTEGMSGPKNDDDIKAMRLRPAAGLPKMEDPASSLEV